MIEASLDEKDSAEGAAPQFSSSTKIGSHSNSKSFAHRVSLISRAVLPHKLHRILSPGTRESNSLRGFHFPFLSLHEPKKNRHRSTGRSPSNPFVSRRCAGGVYRESAFHLLGGRCVQSIRLHHSAHDNPTAGPSVPPQAFIRGKK